MEKGETAVLAVQFGVLFSIVIVIGNFLPVLGIQSGPTAGSAYWGTPATANVIPTGGVLTSATNQTTVYAYFHLSPSTGIRSVSASRFCTDPSTHAGETEVFNTIRFGYNQTRGESFVALSPAGQAAGWSCSYSVLLTDSTGQTVSWTGTVTLQG